MTEPKPCGLQTSRDGAKWDWVSGYFGGFIEISDHAKDAVSALHRKWFEERDVVNYYRGHVLPNGITPKPLRVVMPKLRN